MSSSAMMPVLAAQAVDLVLRRIDRHRKPHGHPRADADFTLQMKRAAHQFDELVADRQAEAGSSKASGSRSLRLHERLEETCLRFGGNADARIFHAQFDHLPAVSILGHLHGDSDLPFHRELDGVAYQVEQHLPQAERCRLARSRPPRARRRRAPSSLFRAHGSRASRRRCRRVRAGRLASTRCSDARPRSSNSRAGRRESAAARSPNPGSCQASAPGPG